MNDILDKAKDRVKKVQLLTKQIRQVNQDIEILKSNQEYGYLMFGTEDLGSKEIYIGEADMEIFKKMLLRTKKEALEKLTKEAQELVC